MRNPFTSTSKPSDTHLLRGSPRIWAVPLHAGRTTHCVRVAHYTALEAQLAVKRRLVDGGVTGLFRQVGEPMRTTKRPLV